MSIDKESSGLPTVSVGKPTTKVNFSMVAAVLFFFAVMAAVAFWVSRETRVPASSPPPSAPGNPPNPAPKSEED